MLHLATSRPSLGAAIEQPHPHELAWDTVQAAAALKLSVTWLEQMRLKGNGPQYVKIGRRVLYRPADVSAWLEANLRRSTSAQ